MVFEPLPGRLHQKMQNITSRNPTHNHPSITCAYNLHVCVESGMVHLEFVMVHLVFGIMCLEFGIMYLVPNIAKVYCGPLLLNERSVKGP